MSYSIAREATDTLSFFAYFKEMIMALINPQGDKEKARP
jgi:hypothetical protein